MWRHGLDDLALDVETVEPVCEENPLLQITPTSTSCPPALSKL